MAKEAGTLSAMANNSTFIWIEKVFFYDYFTLLFVSFKNVTLWLKYNIIVHLF